ncbi:hypothetical protein CXB51_032781 [Gossypium anomalum]|uniref:Sulfotransferase n=1 Tax=Gossypium anomalum TaxID=47600 RepID=A0A8J5YD62_9ROSI|nr:hypothetical protein CXB51_032781 [Gossypium anomalum]
MDARNSNGSPIGLTKDRTTTSTSRSSLFYYRHVRKMCILFIKPLFLTICTHYLDSHVEQDNEDEFQKSLKEMISTLPKGNSWGLLGFWLTPPFLQGVITSYDDSSTPLLFKTPHDVVSFMELDHAHFSANRHLGIPLLTTHAPYSFLPTSIIDSGCKIIYICRDLKDTFVSMYHILTRYAKSQNTQPIELDEAFKRKLVRTLLGPCSGYWKVSLEHPNKFIFLKYEKMNDDTVLYLKKLAEFMGCPFSSEEQQKGMPEKIVKMCSFKNISNLEVNKSGKHREGQGNLETENKIYFRKEKVRDWKNDLTPKMSTRLYQITQQKLN